MSKITRRLELPLRTKNRRWRRSLATFGIMGVGSGSVAHLMATTTGNSKEPLTSNLGLGGAIRFIRSVKIGMVISLDYWFSMLGLSQSCPNYKIMMSRIHQRTADNILQGCLTNGGPYIKLGQGLVSMSHILPKEYISTLKVLQDQCLRRYDDEINDLFIEDLGKRPEEIFKEFHPEPISAASVAQVYKATTQDGEKVAVKVQYIDLQNRFWTDVSTINLLLKVIGFMHPSFNFSWVLNDLSSTLRQELDFVNEGKNAEKCARDLSQLKYIYVPKIYWNYTTTRILVMEFTEGLKVNEIQKLKDDGFSLKEVDLKLFEAFGHQIFQTGFVHADPHPGNVLVRRRKGATELVLLDHGLYQSLNDKDRLALSHMWKAIVFKDHAKMKIYAEKLGVKDYVRFAEVLTQAPLSSHNFKLKFKLSVDDLDHITRQVRERFDSIMECLQQMPRELILVIRNLNTIRAIAHDHGNVIDRYAILARAATKSAFQEELNSNRTPVIYRVPLKAYFEAKLFINKFKGWFRDVLFVVLYRFGFISSDVTAIVRKEQKLIS